MQIFCCEEPHFLVFEIPTRSSLASTLLKGSFHLFTIFFRSIQPYQIRWSNCGTSVYWQNTRVLTVFLSPFFNARVHSSLPNKSLLHHHIGFSEPVCDSRFDSFLVLSSSALDSITLRVILSSSHKGNKFHLESDRYVWTIFGRWYHRQVCDESVFLHLTALSSFNQFAWLAIHIKWRRRTPFNTSLAFSISSHCPPQTSLIKVPCLYQREQMKWKVQPF